MRRPEAESILPIRHCCTYQRCAAAVFLFGHRRAWHYQLSTGQISGSWVQKTILTIRINQLKLSTEFPSSMPSSKTRSWLKPLSTLKPRIQEARPVAWLFNLENALSTSYVEREEHANLILLYCHFQTS